MRNSSRPGCVPRMTGGEAAATTLSLIIHELATNSLKYGALSSESGTLELSSGSNTNEISLVWTERGGPPVSVRTGEGGYGSKLINRVVSGQLDGSITCDWAEEGLTVTLIINAARERCLPVGRPPLRAPFTARRLPRQRSRTQPARAAGWHWAAASEISFRAAASSRV